jgi:alkanesulfonate monooxygenase SsuD/methylene tetrahydromethanopterin reductase-like flavin-dependent oxidoreductase (luciferase family)
VTRFGVVARPEADPSTTVAGVRAADDLGLDALWLWEDCFCSGGIASATAALAASERVHVGLGLMPAPLRNPALAAMEVAGVCRLFPERFTPVFGHGVLDWMAQAGARAASELTLLSEYVSAVRGLLHGERVSVAGEYVAMHEVELRHAPSPPPPVLVGARGPRTLALAGTLADGVVLDAGTTPASMRAARARIDEARHEAGRSDDAFEVVLFLPTALDGLPTEATLAEATAWGYADRSGAIAQGSPGDIARTALAFVEAGATTIAFQTAPSEDPEPFMRAIAGEVLPLVR